LEDIVALRADFANGETRYFITWGRIFHPVDPTELMKAAWPHLSKFQLPASVVSLSVCDSLQEAAGERYFYEALFQFSQRAIPFGSAYRSWAARTRRQLLSREQISYLGNPVAPRRPERSRPIVSALRDKASRSSRATTGKKVGRASPSSNVRT
jgi:hypothetical protein